MLRKELTAEAYPSKDGRNHGERVPKINPQRSLQEFVSIVLYFCRLLVNLINNISF